MLLSLNLQSGPMQRAVLLSSSALFGWGGSSRPGVSEHWRDAVHSTPAATPQSIAVLGATGRTGREFVAQALSRGHTVHRPVALKDSRRCETAHTGPCSRQRPVQADTSPPKAAGTSTRPHAKRLEVNNQVIKGDATDAAAVARTLQDVDCCVCTLGVGPTDQPTHVVSTAAKHVMKQPPAR